MRNYIKYMVFAVAAALLLSGCNTDKAVTTTSDTSAVTEEVTTATAEVSTQTAETAEITTTVTEATTKKTNARTAETPATLPIPKGSRKYYIYNDYNYRVPFDDKAFEIFMKAFYGVWTGIDQNGKKYDESLTYNNTSLPFFDWVDLKGIIETDEIYAITYVGGGVMGCYFIEKSSPDVMYDKDVWYDSEGAFVFVNDEMTSLTGRRTDGLSFTPEIGEISVFGLLWLENEYGEDFRRAVDETIESGIEHDGRNWSPYGTMELDYEMKMYLVSRDENTVTLGSTFLDREELHDHEHNWEIEPSEKTFALTFSKSDGGEWSFTGVEPFDPPEYAQPFSGKYITYDEITELVDKNKTAYSLFYEIDSTDKKVDGSVYTVKMKDFNDFGSFYEFIGSIYTVDEVDRLFNDFMSQGRSFWEENGQFLTDSRVVTFSATKSLYSESDRIEVLTESENECDIIYWFDTPTALNIGDEVIYKPYGLKIQIVRENGAWKLSEMIRPEWKPKNVVFMNE